MSPKPSADYPPVEWFEEPGELDRLVKALRSASDRELADLLVKATLFLNVETEIVDLFTGRGRMSPRRRQKRPLPGAWGHHGLAGIGTFRLTFA